MFSSTVLASSDVHPPWTLASTNGMRLVIPSSAAATFFACSSDSFVHFLRQPPSHFFGVQFRLFRTFLSNVIAWPNFWCRSLLSSRPRVPIASPFNPSRFLLVHIAFLSYHPLHFLFDSFLSLDLISSPSFLVCSLSSSHPTLSFLSTFLSLFITQRPSSFSLLRPLSFSFHS